MFTVASQISWLELARANIILSEDGAPQVALPHLHVEPHPQVE